MHIIASKIHKGNQPFLINKKERDFQISKHHLIGQRNQNNGLDDRFG